MILIITHKTDFTADFVINELNKKEIEYKRFNCEDILLSEFNLRISSDYKFKIFGEEEYRSVWFRRTKLPQITGLRTEERFYVLNEVDSFTRNIFSILDSKWLSPPDSVYKSENKLLQLKLAQELGFILPKTLITNSKEELKSFYYENERDIIVKPIHQTRIQYKNDVAFIFTNKLHQTHIDELDNFDLIPCIYQKNIPKEYEIRVTVVGEKVFAAAVFSQQDEETKFDWRKKKLDFVATELPISIKDACVRLLKRLNLAFGAIDLIKTPEGEYVFLEINPNGQWVWIENQTGQKISEAIIDYLVTD